ncbi:hypothetical protein P5673_001959 [Acropora cervicornis]|uniref:Uncharacterized protein n=1 Tax=Acropora cervicornis TaxID=6130 RepID=A0AAD9VFR9_ACRCE|nr:hypothetical protein P5673_001959 [Acropora cervicornis]
MKLLVYLGVILLSLAERSIATISIRLWDIEIQTASQVTRVYADSGTGAKSDLAVFQADLNHVPEGVFIVGQVAVRSHATSVPPSSIILVSQKYGWDLAPPTGFTPVWKDHGSGGAQDVTFWRVNCPRNFASLGDVAIANYDPPTEQFRQKYACIRKSLLKPGKIRETPIWTDQGSGASSDGSVWLVENDPKVSTAAGLAGFFKVQGGYSKPQVPVYVLPTVAA